MASVKSSSRLDPRSEASSCQPSGKWPHGVCLPPVTAKPSSEDWWPAQGGLNVLVTLVPLARNDFLNRGLPAGAGPGSKLLDRRREGHVRGCRASGSPPRQAESHDRRHSMAHWEESARSVEPCRCFRSPALIGC